MAKTRKHTPKAENPRKQCPSGVPVTFRLPQEVVEIIDLVREATVSRTRSNVLHALIAEGLRRYGAGKLKIGGA